MLGLVTVPYFLPELRKNWPAWKPLVKNGKSNYIGPASVPMMALLHRRALLNSALVRSAEEWLDSMAAVRGSALHQREFQQECPGVYSDPNIRTGFIP